LTKEREALKLALEAFCEIAESRNSEWQSGRALHTLAAIEEALAQPEQDGKCKYCTDGCPSCDARKLPEQEPVAWLCMTDQYSKIVRFEWETFGNVTPLYTTPPQRKPLTDEEIAELWLQHDFIRAPDRKRQAFARAIEAAHGIKVEA
jgi:hypothetical protein